MTADREGVAARVAAWAMLQTTIAERRLDIPAWYARDAVDTVAYLARRSAFRLSRSQRKRFAAGHDAIENAALATLARPYLQREDFDALLSPLTPRGDAKRIVEA